MIVGDTGSGKSIFLRYIALMLARSVLASNPGIALETLCLRRNPLPIPLFVSCWDLCQDFLKQGGRIHLLVLVEFLVQRLAAYGFPIQLDDPRKAP